jgi:flagellar hook-associated protein 1 FlgK
MKLAQETNGNVYNIKNFESEEGAEKIGLALSRDLNSRLDGTDKEDGIPAFRAGLNKLLNGLTKEINAIFRQGANSYGNRHGEPQKDEYGNDIIDKETGEVITHNLDLFVKIDEKLPFQMGNIAINPVFSDLNNMPLSLSGDTGDFQIGNMLVGLSNSDIFSNGIDYATPDEQYAKFILDFGQAANIATTNVETQEDVLNAASQKLLAVSGVSMDEELSNMMKFQYSYTAASKLINVVDEMLETVVNI